jgi:hypothetical protein
MPSESGEIPHFQGLRLPGADFFAVMKKNRRFNMGKEREFP